MMKKRLLCSLMAALIAVSQPAMAFAANDTEVPYMKLGLPLEQTTAPSQYSIYQNLNYLSGNFENGGECVIEIDDLTDPDHMLSSVEKLIAAGCNMIEICPANDTMLVKVAQLCEEAEVYWAVVWREILDEDVREIVYNSPYFVGTAVQDDYMAGYTVTEKMSQEGIDEIAIISLDKSSTTAILRENGIAAAAEEFGVKVVAEARDLAQATDAAQAVESFLVAYPDLDAVFVAASMGLNILDGVTSALDEYDPEGKVKIATIDFLPGLDECLDQNRVVCSMGAIYVPVVVCAQALLANAVCSGERMGGEAVDLKVGFGSVSTTEDFNMFSQYVEQDLPMYTFEEAQNALYTLYNPEITAQDLLEEAAAFDLSALYEKHADLKAPVTGPKGVEYIGYEASGN